MKFSIRDLVLGTIILILLVMWLRAEYKDTRNLQALRLWRRRLTALEHILTYDGGEVTYDDDGAAIMKKDGSRTWASGYHPVIERNPLEGTP